MALLDRKPPEEILHDTIRGTAASMYAGMASSFRETYRMVWLNPDGYTPQQVFDILGPEDGQDLLDRADKTKTYLDAWGKELFVTKPDNYEVDVDTDTGRVIVTEVSA